jgi:hypothetical protein
MQTQPDNFEKSGGSQYQAAGTFVPPPTVCEGAAGVIRGGQGRTPASQEQDASLVGFCMCCAIVVLLFCFFLCA